MLKNTRRASPARPVSPSYTGRVVIIGPFLFDGLARPGPFFDGPHTGRAKTGRAGPFATPTYHAYNIIPISEINSHSYHMFNPYHWSFPNP